MATNRHDRTEEKEIAQIIALCLILASGSSLREGASPLI
jgi:hypothetical protein